MSTKNPPWVPEFNVDLEVAGQLISRQFPQLGVLDICLKGEGWDNFVFQVNEKYMFRFPRRQFAVSLIANETQLLPKIGRRLSLPIPHPIFFGKPDLNYPWPFLGYRLLEGKTACSVNLCEEQRIALVPLLAKFLSELHRISEAEALSLGGLPDQINRLDVASRDAQIRSYLKQIEEYGFIPDLDPLYSILEQSHSYQDRGHRTLVHGDLYVRHLLMNQKNELCGVIDWGDIHIGNPAVDLQIVFSFLPTVAHRGFFELYGEISKETWMLARFRALLSACAISVYGHSIGDNDLIREGKQGLAYLSKLA